MGIHLVERNVMKKLSILLVMGVIGGALVLPIAPAHARFVGAATCDVTLDVWPTTTTRSNSTPCTGLATGLADPSTISCTIQVLPPPPSVTCNPRCKISITIPPPPDPTVRCVVSASVDHYNETCGPQGTLPPLGTADGTLTVDGTAEGGYNWVRVGLTAVLLPLAPGSTAGVAAFAPHPPIPTCAAPGQLTATVVGAAVAP